MKIPKAILEKLNIDTVPGYEQMLEMQVEAYNNRNGDLKGYDCLICKNKGRIAKISNGKEVIAECGCVKIRETLRRIRESGLEKQLRECTFKNYEIWGEWCEFLKDTALKFTEKGKGFLFMGGQSGCGKTHLCTATVGQFIKKGYSARYFVWREDSPRLKALVNDTGYTTAINEYKKTDVLYIDDLFKQQNIGDADIKLAFEIIDSRYREDRITIISSELTIDDILEIDEALAGRIMQMSKGYQINVAKDRSKNYRLRR